MMFEKTIARAEAWLKGTMFDCRTCGQCVLQQTGLICPMTCPKGLRNGPCGGTLHGECEVFPDKQCVWVRIHSRTAGDSLTVPDLLPSPDARLFNTSSYINSWTGVDEQGRKPLPYPALGSHRIHQPAQTRSQLERRLKSGAFVKTCELRAPRGTNWGPFCDQALLVRGAFDAVNATSYLNAKPSLPAPVSAAKLVELGLEPICQTTCRDHTKTSYISELIQNHLNGVHNVLCLTGDSYAGVPKIKQVWDMDSSLMIYEARQLRETGVIHFTGEKMSSPPQPFIGGAINPFTNPPNVPVRRLKQKVAAGVDFIQTQLIFDVPTFRQFMDQLHSEGIDQEVFLIAGVPVVTSHKALAVLPRIPGVKLPATIQQRLKQAGNCETAGVALAREIASELSQITGVAGVHLMLFGPDHAVLPEIIHGLPAQRHDFPQLKEPACPFPT